ncbi:MAG TPA: hypothetical protein VEZ72_20675, partial [Paenibacillus sp.]|nr:hypothetical protein [Paenibacillus sp.]
MHNKRYIGWLALALVAGMLTACGGAPSGQGEETTAGENLGAEQPAGQQTEEPSAERPAEEPAKEPAEEPAEEQPPEGAPPTIEEAAATVARALKAGDLEELAKWAHPEKGVRFSPYAYVDVEKDLVFAREVAPAPPSGRRASCGSSVVA